jgi:hypothetical protein
VPLSIAPEAKKFRTMKTDAMIVGGWIVKDKMQNICVRCAWHTLLCNLVTEYPAYIKQNKSKRRNQTLRISKI